MKLHFEFFSQNFLFYSLVIYPSKDVLEPLNEQVKWLQNLRLSTFTVALILYFQFSRLAISAIFSSSQKSTWHVALQQIYCGAIAINSWDETTMTIKPRRSVLYMPGSNARALEKAKTLGADCFIFDLEDAVAPEAKSEARQQVCDAVAKGGYGKRELVIRINSLDSDWGKDDLAAATKAKPDAILVPKVSSPDELAPLADIGIPVWVMMETPLAMFNAKDIAFAPGLEAFVMGTNDLAKETGASLERGRHAMVPWLMTCVAAACAADISIIDGVYNDFKNDDCLRIEALQGADFGMDGKTIIHPGQIAACNEIFAPSQKEIENAQGIIEAFTLPENQGKGAINLNGRMVELLHCEIAKKTIAINEAIKDKQES